MAKKKPLEKRAFMQLKLFVAEYQGKTGAELRKAFSSLVSISVETFTRMAAIVQVADKQGITDELELSAFQLRALRRIARGEVLPEAYERFTGTPVESHLHKLSPGQQRGLADGGGVPVYSFPADGREAKREVPPLKLTPLELRQAFGPDGIRDRAEQRSWLETSKKRPRRTESANGTVITDPAHHRLIVRVGDAEVSLSRDELLDYLKQI